MMFDLIFTYTQQNEFFLFGGSEREKNKSEGW